MSQTARILLAIGILVLIVVAVPGVDMLRGRGLAMESLAPGGIPIYVEGDLAGGFTPDDLSTLKQVSFTDTEEGKPQAGWLLRDVLQQEIKARALGPETRVLVESASREKSVTLTWPEITDEDNWVMFDLSGRGTLKLISTLERLDVREEWIQDVDRIDVSSK